MWAKSVCSSYVPDQAVLIFLYLIFPCCHEPRANSMYVRSWRHIAWFALSFFQTSFSMHCTMNWITCVNGGVKHGRHWHRSGQTKVYQQATVTDNWDDSHCVNTTLWDSQVHTLAFSSESVTSCECSSLKHTFHECHAAAQWEQAMVEEINLLNWQLTWRVDIFIHCVFIWKAAYYKQSKSVTAVSRLISVSYWTSSIPSSSKDLKVGLTRWPAWISAKTWK